MEPKKDRRTMLEEWRAQNKAKEANKVLLSGSGTQHQHQLVQSRQQPVAQLLVDKENTYSLAHTSTETPSRLMSISMPPSSTERTTAVERFRMRHLQWERRALGEENHYEKEKYHPTPPVPPPSSSSLEKQLLVSASSSLGEENHYEKEKYHPKPPIPPPSSSSFEKQLVVSSSSSASVVSTGTATIVTTMTSSHSSSVITLAAIELTDTTTATAICFSEFLKSSKLDW
eukprot:CAMPEP_0203712940 /NCGR_PEP_ID=MMETSP0091-20130426/70300_1 /ASSEMBLY_ACC=CAM_ASM_001089 /TAXON_ID=426623 /ORGANISM="Chaetoceros affinis, Strain CCMP159" /LENGTH=228 /DNA_ID=CAMNT_0050590939 /DNA_START=187 /DNA_END=876 /DNA_ORIENTATION=+